MTAFSLYHSMDLHLAISRLVLISRSVCLPWVRSILAVPYTCRCDNNNYKHKPLPGVYYCQHTVVVVHNNIIILCTYTYQ